jgi:outer membrane immunogenic protein
MKLKAWGVAVVALAMTSIGMRAQAADVGGTPYAVVNNWSGFYVGANLGFAHGTVNVSSNFLGFSHNDAFSDSQFTAGLLAGYNWQTGNRLWGIEGDINLNSGSLGSVRGRYGVVMGDWLYYGTAGIGFNDAASALVVGGGLETKINSHLAVGVEGLFYWFPDIASVNTGFASVSASADVFAVRGRLTYQLDVGRDILK